MDLRVRITPEAEADLASIGAHIAQDSPEAAIRFLGAMRRRMATLKHFPARHGRALEAELIAADLRQMIHGVYRVLYTFDDASVTVHGVRHGARLPMRPGEITRRLEKPRD